MGYRFDIKEIKEKFIEFNEQYFGGEIDMGAITFKKTMTRRRLGCCKIVSRGHYEMDISGYYDREEYEIETTILHEMIHMYQKQRYGYWNHGKTFKSEASRINRLGGYNISRLSSTYGKELSSEAKSQKQYSIEYIMTYDWKGSKRVSWVSLRSVPVLRAFHHEVVDNIEVYKVDSDFINRYTDKTRRSSRLSGKCIDKGVMDKLVKSGNKISA